MDAPAEVGEGRRTRDLGDQERPVETENFQRSSKAIYRVEGGSFHVLDLGSLEGAVEFAKRGGSARGRQKKREIYQSRVSLYLR